jgi:hypothetical protein
MLYSLPNGKVIEISVEQYLDITDEELEYLISVNYGDYVENPFFGSVIHTNITRDDEIDTIIDTIISDIAIEEEDTDIDYDAPIEE